MSNDKQTVAAKTAKLNQLVDWFDSDNFELEQALDRFAEAETLAAEIEADLAALKNTITIAKEKFNEAD